MPEFDGTATVMLGGAGSVISRDVGGLVACEIRVSYAQPIFGSKGAVAPRGSEKKGNRQFDSY